MKSIDIMSLKSFFSDPSLHSHRHHLFSVRLFFFIGFFVHCGCHCYCFLFVHVCLCARVYVVAASNGFVYLFYFGFRVCLCVFFFRHSILQRITTHFNLIVILKVLLRAAQPSRQSLIQCTCTTCEFK